MKRPSRIPLTSIEPTRRHEHRERGGELELLTEHCACGAPLCPDCGTHTDLCADCGAFHCPEGCWTGLPVGPTFVLN